MLDQKWLDLGFNTSYEIPSGSAVAHGGNPQDRAASPKSKLRFQRTKGATKI
ncbi:hypothetical protein PQG02_16685 [Nostoc sp. UHCC 0926]|uniref:hypothetical protein n=1 Tax=unclassified Nostoc TaxID=2593658 RepID=UPI00236157E0|nr:hypothetical protein [Nostoc sp. UHCC 0926]WDD30418.1 hypothetical protein PQG02_16685 [Nostoc sp. UHCC 0926]